MLSDPLTLPCGAVLPNRLSKAAMTEGLATPDGRPTPALEQLYGIWSDGGCGMLLSGNIKSGETAAYFEGRELLRGWRQEAG